MALANRTGDLETLVAYTHRAGEEEQNFGEPDPQETENNNVLVKLQYQLNENHRIEFTGEQVVSDTDTDLPLTSSWNESYSAADQSERQRLGAKYILSASNAVFDSMALQFDWQKSKQTSQTSRSTTTNSMFQPDASQFKDYFYAEEGYEFSAQFDKSFAFVGMEHYLTYGLSYATRDIENTNITHSVKPDNSTGTKLYYYMPKAEDTKWGAYIQDQIVLLNDALIITPGVRFDSFNTKPDNTDPATKYNDVSGYEPVDYKEYSDSAVTAKLGALYNLTDDTKVFAQISQGFRAPDFQELYYSFSNSMHQYKSEPNPDLKAESSISYETGLRGNFSAGNYEFAVFYSDYDNFIDSEVSYSDPAYAGGITTYKNLDKATIKGAEIATNLWLDSLVGAFDGTTLRLAAAYTEGEDKDGLALNSVAPWNMVVGLNYDSPSANWGTSLKTVYTAKKGASDINSTDTGSENQIENPSSTVVDLTAYYKPIEDLTLRAGVYNLTDEQYWSWNDVRGLTTQDNDLSQAERNYGVTVKYDF